MCCHNLEKGTLQEILVNLIKKNLCIRKFYGSSVKEAIQGPGETIYIPGNVAHAVMNIDENAALTENYFLVDSLEDWIHGMMIGGENLIDTDIEKQKEEELFWKAMYYRHLNKDDRKLVRTMRDQVEKMIDFNTCNDEPGAEKQMVSLHGPFGGTVQNILFLYILAFSYLF